MKRHLYAVKYLDANGFVSCYSYIETMDDYKPGDIIRTWNGQQILIDFEV